MPDQNEKPFVILAPDGTEFDIPVEGSLGLLALGDIGLLAWRQKVADVKREMAERSAAAQQSSPGAPDESANDDGAKND